MSEFQITLDYWYEYGFKAGREFAFDVCFGQRPSRLPDFETPDEEKEFQEGFEDGYNSIGD